MKITSLIVLMLFSVASISQTRLIRNVPYVEVTGEHELSIVPDKILLSIQVSESNKKKSPIEKLERALIDTLKEIGINPEEQLTIDNIDGEFRYGFFEKKLKTQKRYRLTLNKVDHVSEVFERVGMLKVDYIILEEVAHSDLSGYQSQVKVGAIKSARQKADLMLKEIGQEVKGLLFIEELGREIESYEYDHYDNYRYSMGALSRAVSDDRDENLNFREITLKYKILARFEIE